MIRNIAIVFLFPLLANAQSAFISGNDTICENAIDGAEISVSFSGETPFTFNFSIDGIIQPSITTTINPYIINTRIEGNYILGSYNDGNIIGSVSGSGLVTVLGIPTAIIHLESDTISIIYPFADFISHSTGNIVSWQWNFGDNSSNNISQNSSHLYKDSSAIYQASLIVVDYNGCSDTAINNVYIRNEFWIYIPNSFTPDYDMVNDKFCIEYNGIRENTFLLKIFNSQGDLMLQSTNLSELRCSTGGGWGGGYFDDNMSLPLDTYLYDIYFQDFEGWKHQEYGTINLIR